MSGNVPVEYFSDVYGATAADTGARTHLTGLCCTCGRGYFPREGKIRSQTQGDLKFEGRA